MSTSAPSTVMIKAELLEKIEKLGKWQTELCIKRTFIDEPSSDVPVRPRRSRSWGDLSDHSFHSQLYDTPPYPPTPSHESYGGSEVDSVMVEETAPHGLPSVGSVQHAEGKCVPCYFFAHSRGCNAQQECDFCHMQHPKSGPARPSKGKREKAKRLAAQLASEANGENNGATLLEALPPTVGQKMYLQEVIDAKLKDRRHQQGQPSQRRK